MIEWLGISHLFELSGMEAVAGFFTPLAVFAAFAVAQIILPARRVPSYVIDAETGQPRNYRLNGILVFAIALIVWATEITGMPRDWFSRSTVYAVAGGTVTTLIFALLAVFTQPQGEQKNPIAALWSGRVRELSFFNNRFDVKMWFYVVGGTMLSLNALSGAAYHYDRFGDDANPGVFPVSGVLHVLRTGLLHLRARPALHLRPDPREARVRVVLGQPRGLRMAVQPPAVGHGRSPGPRILDRVDVCLAHRNGCAVPVRMEHLARRQHAEIHIQAMARPEVPRAHRAQVHRGRRPQDPVQRFLGCRPPLQLHGRGVSFVLDRLGIRPLHQSLGLGLLRLHRLAVHLPST